LPDANTASSLTPGCGESHPDALAETLEPLRAPAEEHALGPLHVRPRPPGSVGLAPRDAAAEDFDPATSVVGGWLPAEAFT
jgi:hypothetical protein